MSDSQTSHVDSACVLRESSAGVEPKAKAKARGRHVARADPAGRAQPQPKTASSNSMEVFSVAESAWTPGKKSAMDDLDFLAIQWGRPQKIQLAGVSSASTAESMHSQ